MASTIPYVLIYVLVKIHLSDKIIYICGRTMNLITQYKYVVKSKPIKQK